MSELGYTVGRNLVVEYRWAGNDMHRLQPLAEKLVRLKVDVIVTAPTAGTRAAMRATRTIPIVMAASADPVAAGLVATLGRPGGNVTGLSLQTTDLARKRVQLIRDILPDATPIALLAERVPDPAMGTTGILVTETVAVAKHMEIAILVREITTADELPDAFAHYRREGGFVSYGPDLRENYRRSAANVDRILRGATPSELPVEQPNRLALVVNLKTAKGLGLTIPQSVLLRADEVVR